MKVHNSLANIITSDAVPKGTILIVPDVEFVRYINKSTGEVKEYLKFNPSAAGKITNVKS